MRKVRVPFLAAMAWAVACAKPAPPTLTPERATLTRIDAQGIELRLELSAANPNAGDLNASEVTSRVVLDKTHELGTATLPGTITLPAGKTTQLDVPISVKWTDMGVLAQLAASGDAVPYAVDGTLVMGGALLHVGVPFHLEGVITHDQIVSAAVKSLPALRW
jgi:Late embryogenesis abundant protein